MAGSADAGQQLLRQPVPDPAAVLCARHSCVDHPPCRFNLCRDGVDLRAVAPRARLHSHDVEPRSDALPRVRGRHARTVDHVDHFRGAHPPRASMTPSARLSAAIEIFADIEARRRPAAQALKDWGLAHRFAGSGDRAAIAGFVYDALRRKASSAWIMGTDTPRAVLLGMLARERGLDVEAISKLASGASFAPAPLSDDEHARLRAASLEGAPPHVLGDYPEWLDANFAATFGDDRVEEAAALASRAPLDLRRN